MLHVASINAPILVRGCYSPDWLHFGFILAAQEPGCMLGQTVIPGSVRVFAEGHEVDYRTAPEVTMAGFLVTREEVERAAVAHLGRSSARFLERVGSTFSPRRPERCWRSASAAPSPSPRRSPAGLSSSVARVVHEQLLQAFIDAAAAGLELGGCGQRSPRRSALTRRAGEYLLANLDQPFSLRALSEAARCSERMLQYAFHEVYGVGPMGWFQAMKLNEVNRELRAHGPGEVSVTEVALRWGFTHFGRLSVEYRRMFGERPSETLKRASQAGKRKKNQ